LSSTQSIDLNYLEMLVLRITIQSNNNGQSPKATGTIAKVSGNNVWVRVKTSRILPKRRGVTFGNWTILNQCSY
jgi:hypothetical protein